MDVAWDRLRIEGKGKKNKILRGQKNKNLRAKQAEGVWGGERVAQFPLRPSLGLLCSPIFFLLFIGHPSFELVISHNKSQKNKQQKVPTLRARALL